MLARRPAGGTCRNPAARVTAGARAAPVNSMATAPAQRAGAPWRVLGNRQFLALMIGRTLSNWGDALYSLALVWFLYQDTHSVLATAALSAVQRGANVLAGPVAGVLVDRWDRRRTLMAVDAASMGVVLVLAALAWRHALGPAAVYAAVFLLSAMGMAFGPAFHRVMTQILPPTDLAAGNGLYQSMAAANGFLAQSVGGAVVALVGTAWSFLLDALSFIGSIAGVWVIRVLPEPSTRSESRPGAGAPDRGTFYRELREGWRAIRADAPLRVTMIWAFVGTAGGGAIVALVPVTVFQQLHGGPRLLGFMEAAGVLGTIVGGMGIERLSRRLAVGPVLAVAGGVMGLGFVGFGVSRALWLSLVLYAAVGWAQAGISGVSSTLFQTIVPADLMGRVFGLMGAIEGAAGPLAALAGGWLGGRFSPGVVVAGAGAWMAVSGLVLLANRELGSTRLG
jgi:DHA3 family macrolide efflux protein-like MFS transporter